MSPHIEALAVARRLSRLLGSLCDGGAAGPVERAWDFVDEALALLEGDTGLLPQLTCVGQRTRRGRPPNEEQRERLRWLIQDRGLSGREAAALLGVSSPAITKMLRRMGMQLRKEVRP